MLNANFRLGSPENAKAIAAHAASEHASDATKLEALEMLETWNKPGQLDRVMNRYLPLDDRDMQPAKEALQAHFAQILLGSSAVQTKAVEVASKVGIEGVSDILRGYVRNAESPVALRKQALAGLVAIEKEGAAPEVVSLLKDSSPQLRSAALRYYAKLDPSAAITSLKNAIASNEVIERQAAWDALSTIDNDAATSLIHEGLKDYIAGKLPPDVWLNVIEAAEGRASSADRAKLAEFETQVAATDALAQYRDCVIGGDAEAGSKLFFTKTELSCVRCHKVRDTGGEVGPKLTEIGKNKDNRYLLEAIVNPDAKIAENFETVVLLTEDDELISGILRKETDSSIELMDADGKLVTVDADAVVSRKKGKSSMPADLIKHLSRRELRDLVAYLSSLKGD